ncbi:unnamed protein product [Brassica napus]|uniref:(rape) hypothetical protein n=1 Tax=Brassica napus TaxID=3708 RepID=A0A816JHJ1_BRANA|nr:unnamed protein product [Brassica napus]
MFVEMPQRELIFVHGSFEVSNFFFLCWRVIMKLW